MPPFDESLLRDEKDLPSELRVGLERLHAKRPSPERLAAMAAALGVSTGTGTATAANGQAGALASPTAKLLLVTGVVATGAVAFSLLRSPSPGAVTALPAAGEIRLEASVAGRSRSAPPTEQRRSDTLRADGSASSSSAQRPHAPVPSPSLGVAEPPLGSKSEEARRAGVSATPSTAAAEPARADGEAKSAEAPSRTASPTIASPPRAASGPTARAKATETELLRDARHALETSPVVALSLCAEHQRGYPRGGLTQERELIAIAALLRLGRTSSAEERAARFRNTYPRSPHLARLDRLLPP